MRLLFLLLLLLNSFIYLFIFIFYSIMSAHFDWLIASVIRSPSSQPRVVYILSGKTLYAVIYAVHVCDVMCRGIKYNKNHKKNEEKIKN